MEDFEVGDYVYFARIIPSCDVYELKNLKLRLDEQNYLEATKQNILSIYDEIETNQIFGTKEIIRYTSFLKVQELVEF